MKKVLIVDDSLLFREYLRNIIDTAPGLTVAGVARDGEEAVRMVALLRPDIVTMDILMPKMNGYETTRKIMETTPVPIVMVSASLNSDEVEISCRAMEAGAISALGKPHGPGHTDTDSQINKLTRT